MSDEEEQTPSSEEDFSASEEEWKPPKEKHEESSMSSDFEKTDNDTTKIRAESTKIGGRKKLLPASQRNELYNKYKKGKDNTNETTTSKSLGKILNDSQFKEKKKIPKDQPEDPDSESSESSGDDHLIDPNELNLNLPFFQNTEPVPEEIRETPVFECNIGVSLTQSSGEESEEEEFEEIENTTEKVDGEEKKTSALVAKINQASASSVDFQKLNNFSNELEKAKTDLKNFKSSKMEDNDFNISQLLTMGETAKTSVPKGTSKTLKPKKKDDISDSDWEEVEENEAEKTIATVNTGGIEINLEIPNSTTTRRSKEIDIEACIKRKINRVKKEHQVYLHKTQLLCLIAHGNYVNNVLNDSRLMEQCLKLIPSKACYPKDRTDVRYCEQISKWFRGKIALKDESMYGPLKKKPNLLVSILLQIQTKAAICKRDYVLLFIILLRAMGIQCRMVMSLQPAPIRPPQSELCSLSMKKPIADGEKKSNAGAKKKVNKPSKSTSSKSKSKSQKKKIKEETSSDEEGFSTEDGWVSDQQDTKSSKPSKRVEVKFSPKKLRTRESDSQKDLGKMKLSQLDGNDDDDNDGIIAKTRKRGRPVIKIKALKGFAKDISIVVSQSEEENYKSPVRKTIKVKEEPQTPRSPFSKVGLNNNKGSPSNAKTTVPLEIRDARMQNNKQTIANGNQNICGKDSTKDTKRRPEEEMPKNVQPSPRKTRSSSTNTKTKELEDKVVVMKSAKDKVASKKRKLLNFSAMCQSDSEADSTVPSVQIIKPPEKSSTKPNLEKLAVKPSTRTTADRRRRVTATSSIENPKESSKPDLSKLKIKSPASSTKTTETKSKPNLSKLNSKSQSKAIPEGNVSLPISEVQLKKSDRAKTKTIPKSVKETAASSVEGVVPSNSKKATALAKGKTATTSKSKPKPNPKPVDSSEDDFKPSPEKKIIPRNSGTEKSPVLKSLDRCKKIDRRVLSTDTEIDGKTKKKNPVDIWVEVYSEAEEQWISIDLFKLKVHSVETICRSASTPISYVLAWNNDSTIKDISARYCSQWNTVTRKMRVEKEWWDVALRKFIGKKTARDAAEDRELDKIHLEKPLPGAISEFKNHPLYALQRHLLKFEAIYPPNAPSLGFIRNEPVYARECVHTLHSREIWVKQARVVKPFEKPYKIVKARPKWDRHTKTVIKDQPLEVFGHWQTQDYDPPTAENGIVPRNAYGNVELFKACMLPKKTVHLQLPGLNRVCKKLRIDCAPAVIGFDFHSGACHPTFDGFVVCEEFSEKVVEEWFKDQEDQERKEEEKYEKRVYGNWKRLIRGLMIRERLRAKYNFEDNDVPIKNEGKSTAGKGKKK